MPAPTSTHAYVCVRCSQVLTRHRFPTRLPTWDPPTNRSLSTRSLTRSRRGEPPRQDSDHASRPEATNASIENEGPETPRTKGWRSLLENKTLGRASSVLVLRDAEYKKQGRRAKQQGGEQKKHSVALDVEKILSSLKDHTTDAGQAEVNQTIEALRPARSQFSADSSTVVSKREFDHLSKVISDRFNQTQLARYITSKNGRSDRPAESVVPEPQNLPVTTSTPLNRSPWHPLSQRGGPQARKKRKTLARGKKGLAERVLRTIWALEVREENEVIGTMDIRLDPGLLSLLLMGDKSSSLSDLGRNRNVKIEVFRSTGVIRITADKEKCAQVVLDIDRLLREPHTLKIDFGPLKGLSRQKNQAALSLAKIKHVAQLCSCTVETASGRKKLIIRGQDIDATARCQRMLVSLFDLPSRDKSLLILDGHQNEPSVISTNVDSSGSPAGSLNLRNYGRLTFACPLTKLRESSGDSDASADLFSKNTMQIAQSHLQASALFGISAIDETLMQRCFDAKETKYGWRLNSKTRLQAELGAVVHSLDADVKVQQLPASNIYRREFEPRSFIPSISGLPRLLRRVPTRSPKSTQKRLRIALVPSPWGVSNITAIRGLPHLELLVTIENESYPTNAEHLSAILGVRTANVLLPTFNADMRLTRTDYLSFENLDLQQSVTAFIGDIRRSGAGLSSIRLPSSLRMTIPTPTLIPGALHAESIANEVNSRAEVEFEYFPTKMTVEEIIEFEYSGYDLAFRRVQTGDLGGIHEALSLSKDTWSSDINRISSKDFTGNANPQENHSGGAVEDFVNTVATLVSDLRSGRRKEDPLDQDSSSSEAFHEETGPTETTRSVEGDFSDEAQRMYHIS